MLVRIEDLDLDSSRSGVYSCLRSNIYSRPRSSIRSYPMLIGVIDPSKPNIYVNIDTNSLETNSLEKKGAIEVS
jgi:hypothetical protein